MNNVKGKTHISNLGNPVRNEINLRGSPWKIQEMIKEKKVRTDKQWM